MRENLSKVQVPRLCVGGYTKTRLPHGYGTATANVRDLKAIFPRGSKSFLNANPHLCGQIEPTGAVQPIVAHSKRGVMNRTEREFAMFLEAQKRTGEILRYEFEGITLRFAGVRYTADFAVFHRAYIKLIEIKGAFAKGKFERAVERFRHAKTYYGDVFTFELHQRQKGGQWSQLL